MQQCSALAVADAPPLPRRRPVAPVGPAARTAPPPLSFDLIARSEDTILGDVTSGPPADRTGAGSVGKLLALLAASAVVVALVLVTPRVLVTLTDDADAGDLVAYALGQSGVGFTSHDGAYSMMLPTSPAEAGSAPVLGAAPGARRTLAQIDDAVLAVSVRALPETPSDPNGILVISSAESAVASGGTITHAEAAIHDGHPAIDVVVDVPEGTGHLRLVLVDDRLYSASVVSSEPDGLGFERLVETLDVTP